MKRFDQHLAAACRSRAKLLQREVAAAMGKSLRWMTTIETGKSCPTVNDVLQLCNLYGCKLDDMLREEGGE